jgi:hypothetical protein
MRSASWYRISAAPRKNSRRHPHRTCEISHFKRPAYRKAVCYRNQITCIAAQGQLKRFDMLCANRFVRFEKREGSALSSLRSAGWGEGPSLRGASCEVGYSRLRKQATKQSRDKCCNRRGVCPWIASPGFNPGSLAMTAGMVPRPSSGLRPRSPSWIPGPRPGMTR